MSSLKLVDRDCIEQLLGMAGGYVLDFSNRTFSEFFRETVGVDIYAEKYAFNGDSKAKRLRAFIERENDQLVGKVLSERLDYWRYKSPTPTPNDSALLERANRSVEKLLGKQAQQKDSGNEFLKKDFGAVSLSQISSAGPFILVLEGRIAEAVRCAEADSPLAVIFHCGSVLEGLLLGVACANPREFNQAPNSPRDPSGKVRQFHEWTLAQLIDVACELDYLGLDVKKFSHALRDFRNYIHPYQQLSSGFNPDRHTAEICLQVLKAAIASLGRQRS